MGVCPLITTSQYVQHRDHTIETLHTPLDCHKIYLIIKLDKESIKVRNSRVVKVTIVVPISRFLFEEET